MKPKTVEEKKKRKTRGLEKSFVSCHKNIHLMGQISKKIQIFFSFNNFEKFKEMKRK